jgi:CRP/FNR family transcriptional regulator, cyclic AMP receptor protein
MTTESDLVGFVASTLVLVTFTLRDMRALRLTAILSNVAFIVYAAANWLVPILALTG